jgi:tetratricopeptide (TPR) repeat protein
MAREEVQVGSLTNAQVDFIIDDLEKGRILRFDNNLYELAHDTLALKIAEERGADEVALLQIAKIVHDRYQVSTTTKALLNSNELQLIGSLRKRLEEEKMLSAEEWSFVKKSAAANRRRRIISISVITFIILSLTGFTLYSNSLRMAAQEEKEKAELALLKQQQAEEASKKAKYNEYVNKGVAHMSSSKYVEAIEAFKLALEFDSTGQVAKDSLDAAKNKSNVSVFFDKLIEEGDALMRSDETKVTAREKYREALGLNYNNSLAQSKLNKVTGELELLFSTWKKSGDVFFSQGDRMGYQLALEKYRLCRQVRPNDSYIQDRIRECQLNLK